MRKVTQLCDWCGKEAELDRSREYPDPARGWFYLGIAGKGDRPTRDAGGRTDPLNVPGWQLEDLPGSVQVCCKECAEAYLREAARYVAEVMPRRLEDELGIAGEALNQAIAMPAPNLFRTRG